MAKRILEAQKALEGGGWKEPGEAVACNPNSGGILTSRGH